MACAVCLLAVLAGTASAASPLQWGARVLVEPAESSFNHVVAVSCATARLCAATDNHGNAITSTNPAGGAAAWRRRNVDGANTLHGVSCKPSLCVAVDGAGNVLTLTNPANAASNWSAPAAVDAGHQLRGVSCPSSSLCVAVDNAGQVVTSTDPTGGPTKWTAAAIDAPNVLNSVSCPTTSFCVAVDDDGNAASSTNPTGGAGAWSVHAHIDSTNSMEAVSCRSASLCVAGDDAYNIASSTTPAGNTAWKTLNLDGSLFQTPFGVSCPAGSALCVVTDDGGDALTSFTPTGAASAWTRTTVDSRWGLFQVSCGSPALCVAGDAGGYVVVGRVAPPDTKVTGASIKKRKRSATLSFVALGAATGFQCALSRNGAAAAFSACRSPATFTKLKPGRYTFRVRAFNAGGVDATPAQAAFKIPRRPNTKITKAKIRRRKHSATFSFKGTGGAKGFKCRLQRKGAVKASFKRCHSPKTYRHLAHGKYTFYARASNAAGADKTPARRSFRA